MLFHILYFNSEKLLHGLTENFINREIFANSKKKLL